MIIEIIRGNVEKKYRISDSHIDGDGVHIDFKNINFDEDAFTLIIPKQNFKEIFHKALQGFVSNIG